MLPFLSFLSDVQVGQPKKEKSVEIQLHSHFLFICLLIDAKDVVPEIKCAITDDSQSILCCLQFLLLLFQ